MKIRYLKGDATDPSYDGSYKIIIHICKDIGAWGKGFVLAISRRWTEPEQEYKARYRDREAREFGLGKVQFIAVEPNLEIANMIAQRGLKTNEDGPSIRYDALEEGLNRVAERASTRNASVHIPRIGCGLAGGNWGKVCRITEKTPIKRRVAVFVYDFEKS